MRTRRRHTGGSRGYRGGGVRRSLAPLAVLGLVVVVGCWGSTGGYALWEAKVAAPDELYLEGNLEAALAGYQAIEAEAPDKETFYHVKFREALIVEALEGPEAAMGSYAAIVSAKEGPVFEARALYRAASLIHDAPDGDVPAGKLYARIIAEYPDTPSAFLSLVAIESMAKGLEDGSASFVAFLEQLAPVVEGSKLAPTVAYKRASYAVAHAGDDPALQAEALALLDAVRESYPASTLAPKALWKSLDLLRAMGDLEEEWARLSTLPYEAKEPGFLMSTIGMPPDPAPLKVALRMAEVAVLMGKLPDAAILLRGVADQTIAPTYADDALWQLYLVNKAQGAGAGATAVLQELVERFPSTKHGKRAAKALAGGGA